MQCASDSPYAVVFMFVVDVDVHFFGYFYVVETSSNMFTLIPFWSTRIQDFVPIDTDWVKIGLQVVPNWVGRSKGMQTCRRRKHMRTVDNTACTSHLFFGVSTLDH